MTSSSTSEVAAGGPLPVWQRLSLHHLWAIVPVAALAARATVPIQDNSFLWHVRAGTLQLDLGEVLRTDPFSFTAHGESWRTQSWLAELGYGWLERTTGGLSWVPVMLFAAGVVVTVLAGVAVYARVRNPWVCAAAMGLTVWISWFFLVPRPVVLSSVLIALVIVILDREQALGWLLVPLFWIWAAVHGGFVIGLGLVVLEALRRRSGRLGALAAAGAGATLLTAHGIAIWQVILGFVSRRDALAFISEWGPPDFSSVLLLPFVAVVVGVVAAAIRGRLRLGDLWVIAPFLIAGLVQQRTVFPAFLVLLPFAADGVPRPRRRSAGSWALNWAVVGAVTVAVLAVLMGRPARLNEGVLPPPGAMSSLDATPLFHGAVAGGLLIYAGWPQRLVFVDDRAELYGADRFREVLDAIDGEGYRELFDRWDIGQALVRTDWALLQLLERDGWTPAYRGDDYVVLRP